MTVLVTGGAGYIGSHMVWELLDHGEDVVVLDRLSTGFEWAVAPEARLVRGDIGDREQVAKLLAEHGIDAIVHFAGSIIVPESVADPLAYYENNTCKSRVLIEAALAAGIEHFIFSSTAAIYGSPGAEPVVEDHAPQPESPYGRSKWMTELMLADIAAASRLRHVTLRYFNVAGADRKGRTGQSTRNATHLVKVACEAALGLRPEIAVFGDDYPTRDGTCVRDYIHVADLVAAHRLALAHLRQGGGSLTANCGYGRGFTVLEVLEAMQNVAGKRLNTRVAGRRPGDPASIVADASFLRNRLGWEPRHDDLEQICAGALRWEEALRRRNRR